MTYNLVLTDTFKGYVSAMKRQRGETFAKQLKKALRLLAENLQHPGLQVHGLKRWPGYKEAYLNKKDRLIFTVRENEIILLWCGDHEDLDRDAFAPTLIEAERRFRQT